MSSISPSIPVVKTHFPSEREVSAYFETVLNLQRRPRVVRALVLLVLFALTALLDFFVDPDLSLFALYLIPTLYSAWFLGIRWGYGTCLASAVVWVVDRWGGEVIYHHRLIPYWNLAERVVVLTVIVAIVNALRGALTYEYESEQAGSRENLKSPATYRCVCCHRRFRIIPA